MELDVGVGLGLYVAGLVLLVTTLEEKFAKKKGKQGVARVASIITFIFMGTMFMSQAF